MTTIKSKRGGARPGSGLPRIQGAKRVQMILAQEHIDKAKKLGGGKITKGVRAALDNS